MTKQDNQKSISTESANNLLTGRDYVPPSVVIDLLGAGYISKSTAIRLYIISSVVYYTRMKGKYFDSTKRIAKKLNVHPNAVRQAIVRDKFIKRTGMKNQRKRIWVVLGINEHLMGRLFHCKQQLGHILS